MPKVEYSLIITLNQYAGNHEQELLGYLFGIGDHHRSKQQHEDFHAWLRENYPDEDAWFMSDVVAVRPYDEYGLCSVGLDPHSTNAAEIYLDDYCMDEEFYSIWFPALLKRIGDGNIKLRSYREELYDLKIVKVEIRKYTTVEENNSVFNATV